MRKKIALILGTRPEIIKMSPFIKIAKKKRLNFFIIHTGQHYSELMDKVFWGDLKLPEPKYNLKIGSGTHAEQVGKMMIGIEKILMKEKPQYVCVYADLNSSIAGALAATKLHIPIIQLEAGLRSFDRTMPEEINRLVVDRIASYYFAPTIIQRKNLKKEGVTKNVFVFGNMIVDAITENLPKVKKLSKIHVLLGLRPWKYFLTTIHRPAGVDNYFHFKNLLKGLSLVYQKYKLPIIYPIHPRSRKNLKRLKLKIPDGIRLINPLGYFDFLSLASKAKLILSDSGGIQEEAAILKIPLVTLRENTERPETLGIHSNILSGFEPKSILEKVDKMIKCSDSWKHPYGKKVAKKIINTLVKKLKI